MLFSSKIIIGIIIIILHMESACCGEISNMEFDSGLTNYDPPPEHGHETRILSRKRRFLSFPEGSSYQVVMDQTIPIVSKTLVYSVGITVALAWQLPTISLFTIAKLLREKAIMSGAFRRNDENVNDTTLIDTNANGDNSSTESWYNYSNTNQHQQQTTTQKSYPSRINYYTSSNESIYGPSDLYRSQWQQSQQRGFLTENLPLNFLTPFNWTRHDWGSLVARYLQSWIVEHPPNYHASGRPFYPVFGKRSIDERTHPEDKFFLDHHRSTRHELYTQIEKFLEAKGKKGHHCVLRALCESGQRKHDRKPKPFLKSIMKAVFSMPTTHEVSNHHKHRMYDVAHGHVGNCEKKFSQCPDSIWSDDFLF